MVRRESWQLIGAGFLINGVCFFGAGLALSSMGLAIAGGAVALAGIPLLMGLGISAPKTVQEQRDRLQKQPREPKRLRIEKEVFGRGLHPMLFGLIALALTAPVCALVFLGSTVKDPLLASLTVVMSIVFTLLLGLIYQSTSTRFIIDQNGICIKTPFRSPREIKWQDLVSLEKRTYRSNTTYELFSLDSSITFHCNCQTPDGCWLVFMPPWKGRWMIQGTSQFAYPIKTDTLRRQSCWQLWRLSCFSLASS